MNDAEIRAHPDFDRHELVACRADKGLNAIIAVHNSNLGPAAGGCRMFPYSSMRGALTDVLRLSRGMTYKSALAGLPLGGGKSVIIGDPRRDKTRDLLHAMGEFVESLQGRYITAEDSGTSVQDMAIIGEKTRHVSGVNPDDQYGGDPSPVTAYGVFTGIRAAVAWRRGTGLAGVRVAIQGVGNVGYHLARLLTEAGAEVLVADVSPANLARAKTLGVAMTGVAEILAARVDVLAPCALGGVIDHETLPVIRADIVAGAANNQLASAEMAGLLLERGILYAPDYVVNAGGIIDVHYQQQGERDRQVVNAHVERIGDTLHRIFEASDQRRLPTSDIADEMAEAVFVQERSRKPGGRERKGGKRARQAVA